MPRRALVLTGSLGMGHHVITEVVTESLRELGWDAGVLDCMSLLGPVGARAGDWVFRRIVATPTVYDGLHFAHFRPGSRLAGAIDRAATGRLVPALRRYLDDHPADLLISAFATGASAAAKLPGPRPPSVVLCTDVTPYRFWVWAEIDLFLVTSPAAAVAVRRYVPQAQVAVVASPVRAAFYQAPDQQQARDRLGLPADAPCALVMGGGWGVGPLPSAARTLAAAGVQVLVVAGSNARLERQLRALGAELPGVRAFGFTDRVPELMAAADVVVTTPGATTCGEARVVGRPLLLLDVVPGHGRDNIQHEVEVGGAEVCDPDPARLAASVLAALDRAERPPPRSGHLPGEWHDGFVEALAMLGLHRPAPLPPQPERRAARP